ncbi:MAG: hypothetical protein QM756_06445 [Polyangiaceae bacterium]
MTSAHAADPCRIQLVPERAGTSWRLAVRASEQQLAEADASDSDCKEIRVEVTGRKARVIMLTGDGREAERPVERPSDLGPTIGALVITVQQQAAPEPSPEVAAKPEPEKPREPVVRVEPVATDSAPRSHLMLALSGVGRVAAPGAWASPGFGGGLAFAHGGWELGAGAEWMPTTYALSGTLPAGFKASSLSLAASGGVRRGRGSVAWLAGLSLGAAFMSVQANNDDVMMVDNTDDTASDVETAKPIETRVGAYAGFAFPARSRLRLRPELRFGAVPVRFRDPRPANTVLPQLPNFSLGLGLGLEGDVL